jgi:hypothetical protein
MPSENKGNLRKHLLPEHSGVRTREPSHLAELDLANCATIYFSSEHPEHPLEHMLDGTAGRGATRWTGAQPNIREEIVFQFDEPQHIAHVAFEVEETQCARTQEVRAEYSTDGGRSYRQAFVQEYNFSPTGSTYQCENIGVDMRAVTHFRMVIVPNKSGSGIATLTSVRLFG